MKHDFHLDLPDGRAAQSGRASSDKRKWRGWLRHLKTRNLPHTNALTVVERCTESKGKTAYSEVVRTKLQFRYLAN